MTADAYEEVYEILGYMDKATVMKVPEDILKKIKSERNSNFKTMIDKKDIFNEKNVCKETIDLLSWMDYNYWMDEKTKNKVENAIKAKEIEDEKEKLKKYNPNMLFSNVRIGNTSFDKDDKIIVLKESLFKKIYNKILKIFKR